MGKYVEKTGAVATPSELGTGTPDGTTFLRGDSTWAVPGGGGGPHATTHVTGGTDVIASAISSGNAGLMTGADKAKLDGVTSGAEVNVNADWNAGSGDAQILNKPATFPPSSHTHPLSEITDEGALASKNTIATGDIDADAVTFPKVQNIATNKLLGRGSGGSGDVEEITLGTNLSLAGTTLNASGGGGGGSYTDFTKNLGASRRSGTFDITGLSGLTPDKVVSIVQTAAQIASKGNARDEPEMDLIRLTGYVVDANTIRAYWNASGVVVGDYAFAFMISG